MKVMAHDRNTVIPRADLYHATAGPPHGEGTGLRFETGDHGGDDPNIRSRLFVVRILDSHGTGR